MNAETTLSAKGQVVIPKDIRDRLKLEPGDRMDVVERADGVLLRKRPHKSGETFEKIAARIRSRIRYSGPPVSVEEMDETLKNMWAQGGPAWDK